MSVVHAVLGGIVAICMAGALSAFPQDVADSRPPILPPPEAHMSAMAVAPPLWRPGLRPQSRDDGQALALAGHRPMARPLAMVRYPVTVQTGAAIRPEARRDLPDARWDARADADTWTRAVLSAINGQRHDLSDIVPEDIAQWCPAYASNSEHLRDSFWVGMMSALARHESTMNPRAVGGGGQWYGLLQIYPPTAQHFGCEATTGEALMNPTANLACAARIMTVTVRRDQAVALHDGRWQGVAADWGPMTDSDKRAEMMAWTRAQDYCEIRAPRLRPVARPAGLTDGFTDGPAAVDSHPVAAPAAEPLRPRQRPWDDLARMAPYVIARL